MERNPSPAYALPTRAFPVPVLLRSAASAALLLSCFGPRPTAAEDFSSWPRHVDFRIDTSPSGADVAGEVRDFPLRIRLDKSILAFSETRRRGSDLRFSKPDGTPLPYQIDTWDSAAGVAEAWVKLDRVLGGARDQFVRMYWGKPDARDGSNAAAVFDSAQGYVGAWHLGGSGPRANAVAGGASASPSPASVPQSRPGVIGAADSLTGESAHAYLDLGNGYSDFSAGFTFSAWIHPYALNYWAHVFDLGNGTGYENDNIILHQQAGTSTLVFESYYGPVKAASLAADNALVPGRWTHVAVTASGDAYRIYVDGAKVGEMRGTASITRIVRKNNYLGVSNPGVGGFFVGKLDEAELAKVARDPDWIKLSYATQRPDQKAVTVARDAPCAARFSAPADTAVAAGGMLILKGVADCASAVYWASVGGLALRILDPESGLLRVPVPAVPADTTIRLRFSAQYPDSVATKDVLVRVLGVRPTGLADQDRSSAREAREPGIRFEGMRFRADGRRAGAR